MTDRDFEMPIFAQINLITGKNNVGKTHFLNKINPAFDAFTNTRLWSNIALSEREKLLIEALQMINPDIEAIAFVEDEIDKNKNISIAQIKGRRVLAKELGNEVVKMIDIVLKMVNTYSLEGKCCFDDIEIGFHYSFQEKMWEVIFFLAKRLQIRVFATTHSRDCIEEFAWVANSEPYANMAQLIHLSEKEGKIEAVVYTSNECQIAAEQNIDLR